MLRVSHQAARTYFTIYTIEGSAVIDLLLPSNRLVTSSCVLIELSTGRTYFPLFFNGINLIAFT